MFCPLTNCKCAFMRGKIPPSNTKLIHSKKVLHSMRLSAEETLTSIFVREKQTFLLPLSHGVWGGSADAELYLVKDVWAWLGRQEPRGKKCKVGGESLALFACSLSIMCLPSLAVQWKKEKIRGLDNDLSLAFVPRMHAASKSILDCSRLNYGSLLSPCPGPITKPHFMARWMWAPPHCDKTIAHSTSQYLS